MVLPVIVLPVAAGAAGYGCARGFNWSQNAAADRVHGSRQKQGATATCSYPWPPNAFSEYPAHSNSTVAGNLVGALSFVVAFRLQRRYVFQGLASALARGAPGGTGAAAAQAGESTSAFLGATARGAAFITLNALSSSAIAGALTPLVDGDSRPAA